MSQLLQRLHATNATLLQCCRDCSNVAVVAAMLHLLHAIAAMLHLLHAIAATLQRLQTLEATTVQVLENTLGTRSGTESLLKMFLHNT